MSDSSFTEVARDTTNNLTVETVSCGRKQSGAINVMRKPKFHHEKNKTGNV